MGRRTEANTKVSMKNRRFGNERTQQETLVIGSSGVSPGEKERSRDLAGDRWQLN